MTGTGDAPGVRTTRRTAYSIRFLTAQLLRRSDAPGFRLHPLKGDRAGQWSVRVSGNWRVVFRFEDGEAVDVDLIDYH